MDFTPFWRLLHLFFAFGFVGSLVVADWNTRGARITSDWAQRSMLFQIVQYSTRLAGFGSLVLLGLFGNLLSIGGGYSMKADVWLRWVNGIWIVLLLLMALVALPNAAQLVKASQIGALGGEPKGSDRALVRFRFANIMLSVLYVTMLVLMVFRWRS